MKKIIYYPLWKIEKLEKKLNDLEVAGWRLKSVQYSLVFNFEKSKSKCANYIITYNLAKDNTPSMFEYERILLSKYSANKIFSKGTGYNFFRITGEKREFESLKNYRNNYIKHVLFHYTLISLFFLITAIFLIIASIFQKQSQCTLITIYIYTFITFIVFLYRIYGYIIQLKSKSD